MLLQFPLRHQPRAWMRTVRAKRACHVGGTVTALDQALQPVRIGRARILCDEHQKIAVRQTGKVVARTSMAKL
jgi:hypothetical protein